MKRTRKGEQNDFKVTSLCPTPFLILIMTHTETGLYQLVHTVTLSSCPVQRDGEDDGEDDEEDDGEEDEEDDGGDGEEEEEVDQMNCETTGNWPRCKSSLLTSVFTLNRLSVCMCL